MTYLFEARLSSFQKNADAKRQGRGARRYIIGWYQMGQFYYGELLLSKYVSEHSEPYFSTGVPTLSPSRRQANLPPTTVRNLKNDFRPGSHFHVMINPPCFSLGHFIGILQNYRVTWSTEVCRPVLKGSLPMGGWFSKTHMKLYWWQQLTFLHVYSVPGSMLKLIDFDSSVKEVNALSIY